MTYILQYRAATDKQDSLVDNPENARKDCLGRAVQRPLVSGKLGHLLRRRRLRALCLLRNGSDSSNSSYFFV
jgi:hypothetical protein